MESIELFGARNFHFPKYKIFFQSAFSSFCDFKKLVPEIRFLGYPLILKYKELFRDFRFPKYKKSFRLRKCKAFLNIRATMFHSPKYKKI